MKIDDQPFFDRVDDGVRNTFMRHAVAKAQESMQGRRFKATEELGNFEEWRTLGEEIRSHTIRHLDFYLEQLSENVMKRGGYVFFASTKEEATDYIAKIAKEKQAKKIVKSKSMVTEEIDLNVALERAGHEVIETDLGEYILQLDDGDAPSHIVVPALHKNKEQIRDTFKEKRGYTKSEVPEELALFAREQLRKEFLSADLGITGCNFAVAESGSICLVTNEGNAGLVTALPKTQITVMGMERIVPTWEELDIVVRLLCRSAVGQKLTSYVTVLSGPKDEGDVDGPDEFHLVIVDNGRSNILGTEFESVLNCIRCAACVNVCPVYRHIGGHSYGSIYAGPIGAVLSPLLGGYENYKELPYASSLCAACTEVCPVKIPLHELLVKHRKKIVEDVEDTSFGEKLAMKGYQLAASSPALYRASTKSASTIMNPFTKNNYIQKGVGPIKPWTDVRDFPKPSKERFRDWFQQKEDQNEPSL